MTRTNAFIFFAAVCSLLAFASTHAPAQSDAPVRIPLTVSQTKAGTYKADISVGIGNIGALPFAFDTGSSGLHVFGAAKLDVANSGVQCSQTPVSFTVGNPGKVTYSGVICSAPLHLGDYTTPAPVPFAYLTSASCAPANPGCKIPAVNNPKAHGGIYGVFGAGITGKAAVPNPILTLPAPYSLSYTVRLTRTEGELALGNPAPLGAVEFPLAPGRSAGEKWDKGQACLFVNARATGTCLTISFDTGNGVPWIRDAGAASIPQARGLVAPGTRIGFGPPAARTEATSFIAGTENGDEVKLQDATGAPLANVGIRGFFHHIFAYNNVYGVISVAHDAP